LVETEIFRTRAALASVAKRTVSSAFQPKNRTYWNRAEAQGPSAKLKVPSPHQTVAVAETLGVIVMICDGVPRYSLPLPAKAIPYK